MLYVIKVSLHDSNGGDGELLDTLTTVSGLLKDLEEINAHRTRGERKCFWGYPYRALRVKGGEEVGPKSSRRSSF